MAEGIAKKLIGDSRVIISRGISVPSEDLANDKAVQVMLSRDINISNHRSKLFDLEDVTDNIIILTMTNRHKAYLLSKYEMLSGKVETILNYIGVGGDVVDPYGYDISVYDACASQLEAVIGRLIYEKNI